MPPALKRILLGTDQVVGLTDYIGSHRPDLELRVRGLAGVEPSDLEWAQVFIGFRKPPPPGWGSVRWIHCIGAGVDGLIYRKPLDRGILLTKSGEDFGPAIGEWCLTRALVVNQHLAELAEDQRAKRWGRDGGTRDPVLLRGQRAVIVGTGQVGRGVARAFRGLGTEVVGLSRSGAGGGDFDSVLPASELALAVAGADWLVLAAPLTAETSGFMNRERLSRCGGIYLMNVGRGGLIDEAALPEALDRGWISGAALDVFSEEPLSPESPLWLHPKVTISPHISGPSTLGATGDGFLQSLAEIERGERPRLAIDPDRGY